MKYLRGATGAIREAQYAGATVYVVTIDALLETVIHAQGASCPEFVPFRVLTEGYARWNGLPATLNHPMRNGQPISATTPGVLESYGLGTIFKTRIEDRKLCVDAFIDPIKAERLGASRLLARLRAGEVVPVSIGAHVNVEAIHGVYGGKRYQAVWRSLVPDHICLLSDSDGACSVSAGCGTRTAAHHTTINTEYEPPNPYEKDTAALRAAYAQACPDPHVRAAIRLLTKLGEDAPPPSSISLGPLTDADATCDRGWITVDPRCAMYRSAQRGDHLPLAMLLHHEAQHAIHCSDEPTAFRASLAFLQRHHADPRWINECKTHLAKHIKELSHV